MCAIYNLCIVFQNENNVGDYVMGFLMGFLLYILLLVSVFVGYIVIMGFGQRATIFFLPFVSFSGVYINFVNMLGLLIC